MAALAVWYCYAHRYILYYGDAQAHLNISRSIVDSRTPGYEQIGTVWLPLLHVLALPLVGSMWLWSNGLAGSIPVAICYVIAGCCLYLTAREAYTSTRAALVSTACFAFNPNVLYLASVPMTEIVFLAGLFVLLLAMVRFRATQRAAWIVCGIFASLAMSMTRYDGWFLISFSAAWFGFFARRHRFRVFLLIAFCASAAPLYWAAHCWWETGNALDFYNGPYSAKAIQAGRPYPGYHDWAAAIRYYAAAGRLCAGLPLILLGVAGGVCALARERFAILAFLLLTPAFYVWSMHSSGNPIFIPTLPPSSYYNTRYGVAVVALAAFAAGAIMLILPRRHRWFGLLIPVVSLVPWFFHPTIERVICWKESEVNSIARRGWTDEAAAFLAGTYKPGQGILAPFGDVTGVFCRARIPLADVLHEGNGPAWMANATRPDLVHQSLWALAQAGSPLSKRLESSGAYDPLHDITVPGAPALEIFKRKK